MTAVSLKAGATYFAIVYPIGFLLGTVRVLLLSPLVGETAALLFEVPLMLLISWIAAWWSSENFSVPAMLLPRVVMGAVAFVLLIFGELAVSIVVFGRLLEEITATYQSLPGMIGILAQATFALLPPVQAVLQSRRAG